MELNFRLGAAYGWQRKQITEENNNNNFICTLGGMDSR